MTLSAVLGALVGSWAACRLYRRLYALPMIGRPCSEGVSEHAVYETAP